MQRARTKAIILLIFAGVLFSGYLSGVRFLSETCAFNEPCPYFLGYPACYYGFAMFTAMALLALAHLFGSISRESFLKGTLGISGIGILFAGYFTIDEIPLLASEGLSAYMLGLPTCAYGLLAYIAIFTLSLRARS